MSTLINGKHYKLLVIDYYDELISQIDIHAENLLKEICDDEIIAPRYGKENDANEADNANLYYQPIAKRLENIYSDKYKFDESAWCGESMLLKDFVHLERTKAVNEIKKVQKERLEEIYLDKVKPTTVDGALYGKRFAFLIDIYKDRLVEKLKFQVLTLIVDFDLDYDEIEFIE